MTATKGTNHPIGLEGTAGIDSSTLVTTTDFVTGQVSSSSGTHATASATLASDCSRNTAREGLLTFEPIRLIDRLPRDESKDEAYYAQSVLVMYKQNRALRVTTPSGGAVTQKQFIACATGGAQAYGDNRLSRYRVTLVPRTSIPRLVGAPRWGSNVVNGRLTGPLGFTGGAPAVSISAQVTSHNQDIHSEGVGLPFSSPPEISAFADNVVTGMWRTTGGWRWSGSAEWQSARNPVFALNATGAYHCGHPFGLGCA
ncbi:MAG TPA: hypothetical protein VNS09_05380 [Solirubrobacter sp.]|nr:hypothetical protein [Solirubrobacter sp.]